jgi:predicted transcriptional regulator YdeE
MHMRIRMMEENMDYELVNLEEKTVVGVTARTKNSDTNMSAIIGGLWNSFIKMVSILRL